MLKFPFKKQKVVSESVHIYNALCQRDLKGTNRSSLDLRCLSTIMHLSHPQTVSRILQLDHPAQGLYFRCCGHWDCL